ncbi:MAG: hypothetical protein II900_01420 [Prevotella sp.]|nr:hypothetical protein [Prevotella sp.]
MKRIVCNVLMLASVVLMLLSCDSNGAKKTLLKMEVDKIQKELPVRLGSMGDLTTVTYEDDVVTLTYLLNEKLNDIDGLIKDTTLVKENFQCMVARNNAFQKMVKEIADADASLVLNYKGKTSGKVASVTICKEEMANTDNFILTGTAAAEKLVANITRLERNRMPTDVGSGVKIVDAFWEGDNYVYLATLSKSLYTIEGLRMADKNAMKQGVIAALANEPSSRTFIEAMITLRKNVGYRYQIEGSKDHVDIMVSYSELKGVLSRLGK